MLSGMEFTTSVVMAPKAVRSSSRKRDPSPNPVAVTPTEFEIVNAEGMERTPVKSDVEGGEGDGSIVGEEGEIGADGVLDSTVRTEDV